MGAALREQRERTAPEDVGVRGFGRRRTRGLRREELAELAGMSADHLKRVEQGRRHPSPAVLNALARALRADQAVYEHLCALAGYSPAAGWVPRELVPAARRLLDRLADTAVCVCDATWSVVGGTPAWRALRCGDPTDDRWDENVAWRVFGAAPSRVARAEADELAFRRLLVAELRAAARRYPADRELSELVTALRGTGEQFESMWTGTAEAARRDLRFVLHDPVAGPIALDCDVVDIRDGDLRALVFTAAPGTPDHTRLTELTTAG
ncbi:helix-turn-helix domain-containing protein [Saccharopolyspora gregorii]|uniref:Helix-turn-helix domain-containing protein n=1 Tax=Saccharopolyspora gregorii TaxID=33914 RepID=A0ABP6RM04_9PSEU